MMEYGYRDMITSAWQIAVNKDNNKKQYEIDYPFIEPYYLEPKLIDIGINIIKIDGVEVKVYDRDRTICSTILNLNNVNITKYLYCSLTLILILLIQYKI